MTYNIKEGYISNISPHHHNDVSYTEEAQREVYEFACDFMKSNSLTSVIDVGCGSGFKLMKYLHEFNTIGIEVEPCLSFLKSKYPDRVWVDSGVPEKSFNLNQTGICDLVICADVIEHIIDPDVLINYLLSVDAKYYIISTPCREVLCNHPKFSYLYGSTVDGPPYNPSHVREWTFDEFKEYLNIRFDVLSSSYCESQIECQFHLLTSK